MTMRHLQERRAARNEHLFRRLNERLHALAGVVRREPGWAGTEQFVCECAQRSCSRVIELTPEEYAAVRASASRFAVAPDASHTAPEIEDVVERHARYWVVEKRGVAAAEVEALEDDAGPL